MSRRAGAWSVEEVRGAAAEVHRRELPDPPTRTVWIANVDRPALVLGSTQPDEVVDRDAVRRHGIEVVRRRSGGGAVLLSPGAVTWIDALLPAGDPLWEDDVSRSFAWLGDLWVDVLGQLGLAAEAHTGGLVHSRWSRLVCFAGLGPGEVTSEGRKVVGLSQRRTRRAARFQSAVNHRWQPARLAEVLALSADERRQLAGDLAATVAAVRVSPEELVAAVVERLPS